MIMSTKEICKRGLSMTISLTLGNTGFPSGDSLPGHVYLLGKLALGQALLGPQAQDCIFDFHRFAHLLFCIVAGIGDTRKQLVVALTADYAAPSSTTPG